MKDHQRQTRAQQEFAFLHKELEMINSSPNKESRNPSPLKNKISYGEKFVVNSQAIRKPDVQFFNRREAARLNQTEVVELDQSPTKELLSCILQNQNSRKLKGFVDFDLQLNRPDVQKSNAHDLRFEPYNQFPKSYSKTQAQPNIAFEKYIPRDSKVYLAKMSDPLFNSKHLSLIKPKVKGILHFSSTRPPEKQVRSKKQEKVDRLERTLNATVDVPRSDLQPKGGFIPYDKQFPRTDDISSKLPVYMHNITGSLGRNQHLERALRDNHFSEGKYVNFPSAFDPKDKKGSTSTSPKKRNLTFNQLLAKYGYIEDESMTKKQRVRPWHIKAAAGTESDEDSEA